MKIRLIYIIVLLFLVAFFVVKYLDFSKYASEIKINNDPPLVGLEQMIGIDKQRITYLSSFYYEGDIIGFNALIEDQYITVSKLGKVKNNFNVSKILKKPNRNNLIGLPPADVNDRISRYINLSSFPFNIKNIHYYTDGVLQKSYDTGFKEFEFNSSNINIAFNNKEAVTTEFGYVGLRQIMSISFINYQGELYILNTHPLEKKIFKSLHDLSKNSKGNR